jgi:serine/threonine protein kinase
MLITSSLRAKVADFGSVSASLLRNAQQRGVAMSSYDGDGQLTAGVGTPLYMAIEVLEGGGYGPAADVFR